MGTLRETGYKLENKAVSGFRKDRGSSLPEAAISTLEKQPGQGKPVLQAGNPGWGPLGKRVGRESWRKQ